MILSKLNIFILFLYIIIPIWSIKNEEMHSNINDNFLQQHIRVKRRIGGLRIFWRLGRLGLRGVRRGGRMLRRRSCGGMYGYNNYNCYNNYYGNNYYGYNYYGNNWR
uniref:Uncharacterized protein n=1 Tax=Strongyloides papillosus TaxID=174720 RepID=A0A0N5CEX5_STREA